MFHIVPAIWPFRGRSLFIFHAVAHFELGFLHLISSSVAPSEPFLHDIIGLFLKYRPPPDERRACYVTPDLSYD